MSAREKPIVCERRHAAVRMRRAGQSSHRSHGIARESAKRGLSTWPGAWQRCGEAKQCRAVTPRPASPAASPPAPGKAAVAWGCHWCTPPGAATPFLALSLRVALLRWFVQGRRVTTSHAEDASVPGDFLLLLLLLSLSVSAACQLLTQL